MYVRDLFFILLLRISPSVRKLSSALSSTHPQYIFPSSARGQIYFSMNTTRFANKRIIILVYERLNQVRTAPKLDTFPLYCIQFFTPSSLFSTKLFLHDAYSDSICSLARCRSHVSDCTTSSAEALQLDRIMYIARSWLQYFTLIKNSNLLTLPPKLYEPWKINLGSGFHFIIHEHQLLVTIVRRIWTKLKGSGNLPSKHCRQYLLVPNGTVSIDATLCSIY
jgi:hypothetical protein